MARRKLIGLITAVPEANHVKRVLEGIFAQCNKYGYDVAVFASLTHFSMEQPGHVVGEKNIYELINFDLLDGVVVDTISFIENNDETIKNDICSKIKKECRKPVVSLNLPFGSYPVSHSRDEAVFREITEHVLDVHHKTDICFLTGPKEYPVSEERLQVFRDVMTERGLTVKPEQVIYGDFWYTSGTELANKFINGDLPLPEAVICASDYMAIGLASCLMEKGVKVPEEVIVLGFEATQEAALNELSITSFESNEAITAAEAVDMLRQKIEPAAEIIPYKRESDQYLHAGMSCGCEPDFLHTARSFKESFYYLCRNYDEAAWLDNIDIGIFMESYLTEKLSATNTPQECLEKIYQNTYFLRPMNKFFLCLREDWLDQNSVMTTGYPERMKTVVVTMKEAGTGYYEDEKSEVFETKWMLPQMFEENEEPSVYYFSAVHFQEKMWGYSVLQRKLTEPKKIGIVYRNWLRNINHALEMAQAKNTLKMLSIYDAMTGAYNRRGMDLQLDKMIACAKEGDRLFVGVIDMDGLKYVNDNFGHAEGDLGIKLVCDTAIKTCKEKEICIRAGGDEFYVVGVGQYTEADIEERKKEFYEKIAYADRTSGKPYPISASIGCAIAPIDDSLNIIGVVNEADEDMYKSKVERKKAMSK